MRADLARVAARYGYASASRFQPGERSRPRRRCSARSRGSPPPDRARGGRRRRGGRTPSASGSTTRRRDGSARPTGRPARARCTNRTAPPRARRRPGIARPEAEGDHLLVVGVAIDLRLAQRRAAADEAGDRQVEGAPEEVHRAALAAEARTEQLEHRLDPAQRLPELLHGGAVVVRVLAIVGERGRDRALLRLRPDVDASTPMPASASISVARRRSRRLRGASGSDADVAVAVLDDQRGDR